MNKRYNIIYADCPWTFKTYSDKGKGRSPEKHYPCLTLEQIKQLPVHSISADDCALFLWATGPHLEHAFEVINEWGFIYKSLAFVWCKLNKKGYGTFMGTGYWTRANAEICLLATKGNPKRISASVHQIVNTPVQEHSKKPECVRDRIVKLMGDLPRIELFARQRVDGWDCWGNEVESDVDLSMPSHDPETVQKISENEAQEGLNQLFG